MDNAYTIEKIINEKGVEIDLPFAINVVDDGTRFGVVFQVIQKLVEHIGNSGEGVTGG